MQTGYIIVEGVDGFGNDAYVHTDRVYLNADEAIAECRKLNAANDTEGVITYWVNCYNVDDIKDVLAKDCGCGQESLQDYVECLDEWGEAEVPYSVDLTKAELDELLIDPIDEEPAMGYYFLAKTTIN